MFMRNADDLDWPIVTAYLTGNCSLAEQQAVERWLAAEPRHRALLAELRAIWEASHEPLSVWNVDAAVATLARNSVEATPDAHGRSAPVFAVERSPWWTKAAIAVAAALVAV